MDQIILYIASSLDGYIAAEDGNIDWLHDKSLLPEGEDFGYTDFLAGIGITLMGGKTYDQVNDFEGPFPYPDTQNFVFTRQDRLPNSDVIFVKQDPVLFVKQLREKDGNMIWLIGGSQINSLLLPAGLIDRIILTILPIRLGKGIPLFEQNDWRKQFSVESIVNYSRGIIQETLKKLRS